jgi:signal transduction histidine kinase
MVQTRPNVNAPARDAAIGGLQLPLPGPQFRRFLFIFHVVFIAGLAGATYNYFNQPGFAWGGRTFLLTGVVLAEVGLYLRFFTFPLTWLQSRRWWLAYFCASFGLWFLSWRIEPAFEWFLLAYLGQMFGVLPPKLSLPASGLVTLLYFPTKIGWHRLVQVGWREWVGYLCLVVGWTALGLFIHKLAVTSSERAKLIEELEAARTQVEAARERDAELAALRERERLARELHDSLGHNLVTLTVHLEAVQRLYDVDRQKASALINEMKALTRTSMEQLRRSLAGLRAPGLGERPLRESLDQLCCELAKRTGLLIECQVEASAEHLKPAVSEAVWRIAQEALANAEKHARAKELHVEVGLRKGSGIAGAQEVIVNISDDGVGLSAQAERKPGHYGLRGLRERVEGLGGVFSVSAGGKCGTSVQARIPVVV